MIISLNNAFNNSKIELILFLLNAYKNYSYNQSSKSTIAIFKPKFDVDKREKTCRVLSD